MIVLSALMDHECLNLFSGKSIWKVNRGFIHSSGNHSKTTKIKEYAITDSWSLGGKGFCLSYLYDLHGLLGTAVPVIC